MWLAKDGTDNESGHSKGVYNMVVEIPRWTNAKMEVKIVIVLLRLLFVPAALSNLEGIFVS